jgi:hypothetical protein
MRFAHTETREQDECAKSKTENRGAPPEGVPNRQYLKYLKYSSNSLCACGQMQLVTNKHKTPPPNQPRTTHHAEVNSINHHMIHMMESPSGFWQKPVMKSHRYSQLLITQIKRVTDYFPPLNCAKTVPFLCQNCAINQPGPTATFASRIRPLMQSSVPKLCQNKNFRERPRSEHSLDS